VELLSVGSPATSKNALVVGASRSSRESGGYARYAHREVWPERFSAATGVSADNVSGDPASLAGFSSRGPCDDDRLKPDLVAPGTDVLSTRSQDAPGSSFWGTSAAHGGAYAYMGGTSMAAPLAAGCAALVREYYRRRGHDRPSAALIKATLLNGARRLHGTDATAGPDGEPNFHQGFGCVFLPSTLPSADNGLSLAFVDTWSDGTPPLRNGGRHQWEVEVGPGAPLRICLAYSDVPARALQNDLDVFVVGPGTSRWRGNAAAPVGLVRGPDRRNNVEAVRIPEPEAGRYLVQVTAWNLLHGPQHYALVVTAAPSSPGEASCHLRRRS